MIAQKQEEPIYQIYLSKKKQKFIFKESMQKILGVCPMFNGTCVGLAVKSIRQQMVFHMDAEGNILKSLVFDDSNLFPYVITSDREIVWVDNDRDLILQWNVQTYQLLQFPFTYNNDTADTHNIFVFPETKLLCIAQYGRQNSNFFRLTYYNYPLTKESKSVHTFQSIDVWTYEHTVRRANTKSMFTWFRAAHKEEVEFKSYELIPNLDGSWQGKFIHHKAKNHFQSGTNICELSVGNIWEMTYHSFLIVSITDRPHTEEDWPNSLFIYEADNNIFREAKFAFHGKFRFQYIHYYSMGNFAMIRSFDFEKGAAFETPVYYIDKVGERIAAIDTWKCSHLNKFCLPGYDKDMIIDSMYENGDVTQLVCNSVSFKIPGKIATAFMIENLVENCDEDLMKEVIDLFDFPPFFEVGW